MTYTQLLLGINAALIAALAALPQIAGIDDVLRSILGAAIGIALAFIGPFIPKVSLSVRRMLDLRRG